MTHKPTPEQQAVIDAARDTKDNLLVNALAGAAKTSTLIMIAEALPKVDILSLAFNKKIATEMADRLPSNCHSKTLNALGHKVWSEKLNTRLRLNFKKMYELTREYIEDQPASAQDALWKGFKEILSTTKDAKSAGYLPERVVRDFPRERPAPLLEEGEFYSSCEFDLLPYEKRAVDAILYASVKAAFAGDIDFDDQILMPSCFKCVMPLYKLVMVDEAQDLSSLNHRFLEKLARFRLIAVGDPCQAIYGFRGAHEQSMAEMKQHFQMTELQLSVSFRCPQAVVEHVQWRAPHMQWWDGNPSPGSIVYKGAWSISDVPDNAAVICRNNAPLFRMAIAFLREGRYPKLLKGDIVTGLINHMKKLGPTNMKRDDALAEVKRWRKERLARSRAAATINDQAECMEIFVNETDTLGAAIAFATSITEREGPIEFMTGHKSKGLEYKQVFFLDSDLVGDEGQERNLRYVICTRALEQLTYITTTGCVDLVDEEAA